MNFKHLFPHGNRNSNCQLLPALALSAKTDSLHLLADGLTQSDRIISFVIKYSDLRFYIQNCFQEILHALVLYSYSNTTTKLNFLACTIFMSYAKFYLPIEIKPMPSIQKLTFHKSDEHTIAELTFFLDKPDMHRNCVR